MRIKYCIVGELTNTDVVMNQTLWLGVYPALGDRKLDYIVSVIEDFFNHRDVIDIPTL